MFYQRKQVENIATETIKCNSFFEGIAVVLIVSVILGLLPLACHATTSDKHFFLSVLVSPHDDLGGFGTYSAPKLLATGFQIDEIDSKMDSPMMFEENGIN